jgi:predicted nucleotidyltransferase
MKLHDELKPFRAAIESIQKLLAKFNNRGVIIGGVAVGFLGKPRFTEDIDAMFLLSLDDIQKFLEAAGNEGIEPRIPDSEKFARRNRVLLMRHDPTEINIDISLGILPFEEEVVSRAKLYSSSTLSLLLPTPEDLIIMKAIAHRPKDLEDIRTIAENHPTLDRTRIEHWVKSFAEVLELPDLWKNVKEILDQSR